MQGLHAARCAKIALSPKSGLDMTCNICTSCGMPDLIDESPAARVIGKFGGIDKTAEVIGRHRSVVNRWLSSPESGGTGGVVPGKHQQPLLDAARAMGIDLAPKDFFVDKKPRKGRGARRKEAAA